MSVLDYSLLLFLGLYTRLQIEKEKDEVNHKKLKLVMHYSSMMKKENKKKINDRVYTKNHQSGFFFLSLFFILAFEIEKVHFSDISFHTAVEGISFRGRESNLVLDIRPGTNFPRPLGRPKG